MSNLEVSPDIEAYIDSEVDFMCQELRHRFDFSDEDVIKLVRESLKRLEEL